MKEGKPQSDAKEVNAMFTNFSNLAKKEGRRYNAGFLYFCIGKLHERHGQSMRYLMCKLIEQGIRSHPVYGKEFDAMAREYAEEGLAVTQ